jgi:hypothetical protein
MGSSNNCGSLTVCVSIKVGSELKKGYRPWKADCKKKYSGF